MTSDDYLHIFRTFWPSEGYAGIVKHLPDWSHSRASNFAYRNGIKMSSEAKTRLLEGMSENARNTRKREHCSPIKPERTLTNSLLMGKW